VLDSCPALQLIPGVDLQRKLAHAHDLPCLPRAASD